MKILYFHPMVRVYRKTIFKLLSDRLDCDFLLTNTATLAETKKEYFHIQNESWPIIKSAPETFILVRQLAANKMSNFSFDIFKYAFSSKYRVIIYSCCTSVPFLATSIIAKIMGKKIILFDEMWKYPYELKKYQLFLPFVRFLLKYIVDSYVCAGSCAKTMLVEEFGVAEEKTFVAHNTTIDYKKCCITKSDRNDIEKTIRTFANGRKVVLYLGRIVQYKGLDVLLRCLPMLESDVCLIVVGSGPFEPFCQNLAAEVGGEDQVFFWGACQSDEAPYFYLNCDIFVLPTRFFYKDPVNCESWGFTVNEAMSLEVPVVTTTAVGAAFDLMKDGETGMMAEENNSGHLAEKINYLLIDEQRRIEIGKNGRKFLLDLCDNDKNYEAYRRAVDFALGER